MRPKTKFPKDQDDPSIIQPSIKPKFNTLESKTRESRISVMYHVLYKEKKWICKSKKIRRRGEKNQSI